jgi:hypothetical protein
MYKPIVWVASTDGTGWAARSRDIVDYSFKVIKETLTSPAMLVVKQAYTSNPKARARLEVGVFYFDTGWHAKVHVEQKLIEANKLFAPGDTTKARSWFMEQTAPDKMTVGAKNSWWYSNPSTGRRVDNSNPSSTATAPIPTSGIYNVVDNEWVTYKSVTEQVQEAVEPAFDPSSWKPGEPFPSGYLPMGNKLIKLAWPN